MASKRRQCDSTTKFGEGKMSRPRREIENEPYVGSGKRRLNRDIDRDIDRNWNCNHRIGSSDLKSGEFLVVGKEGETGNNSGGSESSIVTGCDPKEFKRVVSRISNERIILIIEMGFGPVHNFRCEAYNMQFYGQRWYEGYNSGDQRMRIALEVVNSPLNECRDDVWDCVYLEKKNASNLQDRSGSETLDPLLDRAGMRLKPRVPRR